MKNKKIILAGVVVILLGALIAYQYAQKMKKDISANDNKTGQEESIKGKKAAGANKENSNEENLTVGGAKESETTIIYFYGAECPHCKDVIAYLDENDIYSKVDFIKKEVWHNKSNGEELRKAALKCGMNPANIGVPFLFSEGKCFMGGPDVMNFFSEKAGIKK
ncbi:MAG: hypothetical protein ACD_7C00171G0007 [uncultured bacterium]|nr:MAG: hypothetical protein ACD_7C00171G0007 [uncultured bacterium]HBR79910.1 hypothetical protein [Candidatus Moranbacteria bacterium]